MPRAKMLASFSQPLGPPSYLHSQRERERARFPHISNLLQNVLFYYYYYCTSLSAQPSGTLVAPKGIIISVSLFLTPLFFATQKKNANKKLESHFLQQRRKTLVCTLGRGHLSRAQRKLQYISHSLHFVLSARLKKKIARDARETMRETGYNNNFNAVCFAAR